jgi:hypothetical protein
MIGLAAFATIVIFMAAIMINKSPDIGIRVIAEEPKPGTRTEQDAPVISGPAATGGGEDETPVETDDETKDETEDRTSGAAMGEGKTADERADDGTSDAGISDDRAGANIAGIWNGDVYVNDFADIKYTLRGGWERRSEAKPSSVVVPETGKLDAAVIVNRETGDNIFIRFFDLSSAVGGTRIYETEFLNGMKEAGERDAAADTVFGEVFTVRLAGRQYLAIREELEGVATVYYLARRIGDMMNIITVKTDGELSVALANFSQSQ